MEEIIRSIAAGAEIDEAAEKAARLPASDRETLIAAVAGMKNEHAARFLTALYPLLADKKQQKFVKKALFRLKTTGIHVEDPRVTGEPVLKRPDTSREARALLSNYDEEQVRVALVAFQMRKNDFALSHAVIKSSRGLVEMKSMPIARGDLKTLFTDYQEQARPPMMLVEVSAPYAAFVVEEEAERSGNEIEEARSLRHFMAMVKNDIRRPEDVYRLGEGTAVEPAGADILGHEMFEPLLLEWPGMEDDAKKLDDVVNPSIVLPPQMIEERRRAFLDDLVASERLAPKAPVFKRMLEDYAYLLFANGEPVHYMALRDLLKDPAAVRAALLRFVQKSLDKKKAPAERTPGGLIVDPYTLGNK